MRLSVKLNNNATIEFAKPLVFGDVELSAIDYRNEQSRHDNVAGELEMLIKARNTKTGANGHIYFYQAWDKQSIEKEELRASHPDLCAKLPDDWYCYGEMSNYDIGGTGILVNIDSPFASLDVSGWPELGRRSGL